MRQWGIAKLHVHRAEEGASSFAADVSTNMETTLMISKEYENSWLACQTDELASTSQKRFNDQLIPNEGGEWVGADKAPTK